MSGRRIVLAVVSAAAFVACTHDSPTPLLSPNAGAAPGYQGGTRVTLSDGAVVTLPNGAPVTTPIVKGANGKPITTAKGYIPARSIVGATTTTAYVMSTGEVTLKAPKDPPALAFPKLGVYGFRETINPDDGGTSTTRDLYFQLASPDQHEQVRWQESDAQGAPTVSNSYIETHSSGGLWLTTSTLNRSDNCDWSPKSPELPKSVIAKVGTAVTADSTCTTKLNGQDTEFTLHAQVKSLAYEDLLIGNTTYRCIKVVRDRVLKQGATELITTAHEWYAFDLGIRVKVLDHTVTRTDEGERSQTRDLGLTSKP
ncbi:MAG: hypothetical protein QOI61_1549 [Actinomycetota bacterium]|jgi:hypothetical protein